MLWLTSVTLMYSLAVTSQIAQSMPCDSFAAAGKWPELNACLLDASPLMTTTSRLDYRFFFFRGVLFVQLGDPSAAMFEGDVAQSWATRGGASDACGKNVRGRLRQIVARAKPFIEKHLPWGASCEEVWVVTPSGRLTYDIAKIADTLAGLDPDVADATAFAMSAATETSLENVAHIGTVGETELAPLLAVTKGDPQARATALALLGTAVGEARLKLPPPATWHRLETTHQKLDDIRFAPDHFEPRIKIVTPTPGVFRPPP